MFSSLPRCRVTEARAHLGQHFIRVHVDRLARTHLPELQDRPVAVEQVCRARRELATVADLGQDSELCGESFCRVRMETEDEAFLLAELGVAFRDIDARAENLDAGFAELLVELVEAPHLPRSAAGERGRIEEDDRGGGERRGQLLDGEPIAILQLEVRHEPIVRVAPSAGRRNLE